MSTHGLNMGGSLMSFALLFRKCGNCLFKGCSERGVNNADCIFERDVYDATFEMLKQYQIDNYVDQLMAHRIAMLRVKLTRADMWLATSDVETAELAKVTEQANRLEKIMLQYLTGMGITRDRRVRKELQAGLDQQRRSLTKALSSLRPEDKEVTVETATSTATRVKRMKVDGSEEETIELNPARAQGPQR